PGLRRPAGRAGRRGRRRRRWRGGGSARDRATGRRGVARARGERGGQAQAARRRRAGPRHLPDAREAGRQGPALRRLRSPMPMPDDSSPRNWIVALVGYGEVGRILAEDLRARGVAVRAWDIELAGDDAPAAAMRSHAEAHGVLLADSHAGVVSDARLVVSAVTASQTVAVARACAPALAQGAWFLDFNSASPGAKRDAAAAVDGAGGRYVEGAAMTSVPPHRIRE